MKLNREQLKDTAAWQRAGITLPAYDVETLMQKTSESPVWVHFGAGNIFRAFPCASLQQLLNAGEFDRGVIACESYDPQIVDLAYTPFDNLSLLAILRADGAIEKHVIGSVTESLKMDDDGIARMQQIFENASLQMVSLTVTEKAYTPGNPLMSLLCLLLAARSEKSGAPIAMVSMDNCSHNGEKLRNAMLPAAETMVKDGKAPASFLEYMQKSVSFPITMIDKITPHPDAGVAEMLSELGFEDTQIIHTDKGSVTAAFVNAEQAQYLVVEDKFPNGRPPLEKAGVVFTDRETVDKVEKMKVGTCLNPLHTALAVLGCLLGFERINQEMRDDDLRRFVEILGYDESLPVVEDPGVLSPKQFLDEVLTLRLPNPFLPDTPQRIAADTSQKLPVRFGWTITATENPTRLTCVPFVFAAWLRYLTGVDDAGNTFTPSADPRMAEVQARMAGGLTDELLSDASLFGADLVKIGLAPKVRSMFSAMMQGEGAVRRALKQIVATH